MQDLSGTNDVNFATPPEYVDLNLLSSLLLISFQRSIRSVQDVHLGDDHRYLGFLPSINDADFFPSLQPNLNGPLENDIIVREMTYGITNRMTGRVAGRCLQLTEVGGVDEGWSDAFVSSFSRLSC